MKADPIPTVKTNPPVTTTAPETTTTPSTTTTTNIKPLGKSLESQYGSQMAKSFGVPTSCGICNRITKSLDGNVCGSCQDSMNTTQWHSSHLS